MNYDHLKPKPDVLKLFIDSKQFSCDLGVLATGSNDTRIRLWNPIVTARYHTVMILG
jgi:hypothetical protein